MLTEAQQRVRATGVGSSDIGAVAGLSPYARPIDVWMVKRGLAEVPETEAMRLGTALEPVVAGLYAREHLVDGEWLAQPSDVWPGSVQGTLRHTSEPWIVASPDRAVVDRACVDAPGRSVLRLVEIKTVSHRSAHHWGEAHDDVPPWYRAQIDVTDAEAVLEGIRYLGWPETRAGFIEGFMKLHKLESDRVWVERREWAPGEVQS
jgi:putative phage-type endonuclease